MDAAQNSRVLNPEYILAFGISITLHLIVDRRL
jgi:hypothetical protein